jgi:RNA polymerase III transcription factor (TF)IIIC subunit HTH domain/Tau95 Triple barrel domain
VGSSLPSAALVISFAVLLLRAYLLLSHRAVFSCSHAAIFSCSRARTLSFAFVLLCPPTRSLSMRRCTGSLLLLSACTPILWLALCSQAVAGKENTLGVRLRPRGPFHHSTAIPCKLDDSSTLLLCVKRRKPNPDNSNTTNSNAGDQECVSTDASITACVVGEVTHSYRCEGLADFLTGTIPTVFPHVLPTAQQLRMPHTAPEPSMRGSELTMSLGARMLQPVSLDLPPAEFTRKSNNHLPSDFPFKEAAGKGHLRRQQRTDYRRQHRFASAEPVPSSPATELVVTKEVGPLLVILERLLARQPIWNKAILVHKVRREAEKTLQAHHSVDGPAGTTSTLDGHTMQVLKDVCESTIRAALPFLAYEYQNGPWRRCWVRFGYDPKKHPEART